MTEEDMSVVASLFAKAADQISADIILTGGVRSLEDMQDICNESNVQFLECPDRFCLIRITG